MAYNPLAMTLKEHKLTVPNLIDRKRNLDVVLTAEEYKYVLFEECPPMPTNDSSEKEIESYRK